MSYNLVDAPFIFATYHDGTTQEVGLRKLFADAEDIVGVSGDTEIQEFPLVRMLVAILYGALPVPALKDTDDWADLWDDGYTGSVVGGKSIKELVDEYLTRNYKRFDLQGDTPFMGVVNAEYKKGDADTSAANLFIDHITLQGLSLAHFSMRNPDFFKSLAPAVVARALVELQAYRVGSKKSVFKEDPRTSKLGYAQPGWTGFQGGILIRGENLAQTLLLNTAPYNLLKLDGEDIDFTKDKAVWERAQDTVAPIRAYGVEEKIGKALGPKELLTHQPARVQLLWDEDAVVGCKIGIGDRIFSQDSQVSEPHSTQALVTAQDKKSQYWRPRKLGAKQFWRGFTSLLAINDMSKEKIQLRKAPTLTNYERNYREIALPHLNVSYFEVAYGTQDAIVDEITVSHLSLPGHIYGDFEVAGVVASAAGQVDDVLEALQAFQKRVFATLASRPASIDLVSDAFLFKVGSIYRNWVQDVDSTNLVMKKQEWEEQLKEVIVEVLSEVKAQAPTEAFFPTSKREFNKRPVLSVPQAEAFFWATLNKRKVFG